MNPIAETSLAQSARIVLPRATSFVDWLVGIWRDKGVEVRRTDAQQVQLMLAEVGSVEFHVVGPRELHCAVLTATRESGELLQLSLTEYLGEFADEMLWPEGSWTMAWEGQAPRSPAQLHVMSVIGNEALTPCMRRLRLHSDDLQRFASEGLHVRMLLPVPGHPPAWPGLTGDGRLQWPAGKPRMPRRTYTIRRIDVSAAWMDVDVLLHEDADGPSPGSVWAEQALIGSTVGVLSPATGLPVRARHHVWMADACALPAAARMVEMLPKESSVSLLLWVANEAERATFDVPASVIQPQWICSGEPGASAPEIAQVLQWLGQQDLQGDDVALWVAGCLPLAHEVRGWVAKQPPCSGLRKMIHTYWR